MEEGTSIFSWAVPGGGVVVAALAVVGIALLVWTLRELPWKDAPRRAGVLAALRMASLVIALVIAMQPSWSGAHVERKEGRLVVLLDDSASMGVSDGDQRRSERVRQWIAARSEADRRRITLLGVASGVASLDLGAVAKSFAPKGPQSRLLSGVTEVAHTQDVGAVLLLSDGADRSETRDTTELVRSGIKVHAALVGDETHFIDDAIVRVKADVVAFLRQEARVAVSVRSSRRISSTVAVALRRNGALVHETDVTLDEEGRGQVEIPFVPAGIGREVYELSIPLPPGDDVPENNNAAFLVNVRRDRLRVLHVAGRPSWDERFLRAFLKRDPSIDLVSFFILRTATDLTMASPNEMALIPFPTDELFSQHLRSFDVVIFQNFNYAPYQMAPYLSSIRDYVLGGGAFAMVGGELSFAGGEYGETPIQEILPVVLPSSESSPARQFALGRFRPVLNDEVSLHPLVALRPEPEANRAAWSELSQVDGANIVDGVRPGAEVLLRHPTYTTGAGRLPILVVSREGQGRVLALTIDGSWRWGITTGGATGDASAHHVFWDRALRWLAKDPAFEPSSLTTDRERVPPNAPLTASGMVRDARYVPITQKTTWRLETQDGKPVGRGGQAQPDARGRVKWTFVAPEESGVYRVRIGASGGAEEASEVFVVEAGAEELANAWPDAAFMRGLAKDSDGKYFESLDDIGDLDLLDTTRAQVVGRRVFAPLASVWAFLLLVAAFGTEWIVRRRWGLR